MYHLYNCDFLSNKVSQQNNHNQAAVLKLNVSSVTSSCARCTFCPWQPRGLKVSPDSSWSGLVAAEDSLVLVQEQPGSPEVCLAVEVPQAAS